MSVRRSLMRPARGLSDSIGARLFGRHLVFDYEAPANEFDSESGSALSGGSKPAGWSSDVARRFRMALVSFALWFEMPGLVFCGLTYGGGEFTRDIRVDKKALRDWLHDCSDVLEAVWILEYQKRGVPHFHFVARLRDGVSVDEFEARLKRWWIRRTGFGESSAADRHKHWGHVEPVREDSFGGIAGYLSKELSKSNQKQSGAGRCWGFIGDFEPFRVEPEAVSLPPVAVRMIVDADARQRDKWAAEIERRTGQRPRDKFIEIPGADVDTAPTYVMPMPSLLMSDASEDYRMLIEASDAVYEARDASEPLYGPPEPFRCVRGDSVASEAVSEFVSDSERMNGSDAPADSGASGVRLVGIGLHIEVPSPISAAEVDENAVSGDDS